MIMMDYEQGEEGQTRNISEYDTRYKIMDHKKGRRREKCQNVVLLLLLSFTTNSER